MAPVVFALISLLCMFQALAAPLHRRDVSSSPECLNAVFDATDNNILVSQIALGGVNSANALNSTRALLQTELSLLDASDATAQIHDSGVLKFAPAAAGAPPAPANVTAVIMAGLLSAQTALNQITFGPTSVPGLAVAQASGAIASALADGQKAVTNNCTTAT
ncbi:hypothetical protein C8R44DRAFT_747534 [Mycena epipterygia]|nr:hypothetical protein C8R44DRAFT_747534 [Mycena epipterygia]